MDGRLIRTYCNEAGDYVVPNVLSPRDLVSRPDNMDETVLSSCSGNKDADQLRGFCFRICKNLVFSWRGSINILRPCHTLPDSANGRVTDSKILCPFVSVRMRFLSVPRAVNAFRVR